ncbi:MAG: hypothetical protein HY606_05500 [Planctomycetes bacterium]|nr:hypothetical protein [Planctomycetota bacterium]
MFQAFRILFILFLAISFIVFVLYVKDQSRGETQEKTPVNEKKENDSFETFQFRFVSNNQCKSCHQEIWDELSKDQHMYAWFNGIFFPQDPGRTECSSCHAPQPILEIGIQNNAVVRNSRFEEGVGCIECHKYNDEVHGPLPSSEADCNPRFNKVFKDSSYCNPCHAFHGTYNEWKTTKWAEQGVTCQQCHMPEVDRPSSTGGKMRKARSHKMLGPRSLELLQSAVSFECNVINKEIVISLSNTGAAHNVPGEISNRELFLMVTVTDKEGKELAKYRESFKAPPRQQRSTEQSTQLKPGETRKFTYKLGEGSGKAAVKLGYRLNVFNFFVTDESARALYEKVIEF